jgi:hypothetical protein
MVDALGLFVVVAAVLMAAATAIWVVRPLTHGGAVGTPASRAAVALLARREAVLAGLRDLEADHADGRVANADYERLRAEALAEGAAVLQALDRMAADAEAGNAQLLSRIEAEIAQRRARGADAGRASTTERGPVCEACGRAHAPGDSFCAGCGSRLGGAAG